MRSRSGKSARLTGIDFDREAVNKVPEAPQAVESSKQKVASEDGESEQDQNRRSKKLQKLKSHLTKNQTETEAPESKETLKP